jgi:hypothetical protein
MKKIFRNPYLTALFCMLIVCTILFLSPWPINLFDGEYVLEYHGVEYVQKAKLSLGYFLGIGADEQLLKEIHVTRFYLTGTGYLLAALFIFALPALIGYRVWIGQQSKNTDKK